MKVKSFIVIGCLAVLMFPCPTTGAELISFCRTGAIQKIIDAIHNGANVNESDADGQTPLMAGAMTRNNSQDVVTLLLAAGADVNAHNKSGLTPLMMAVIKPMPEVQLVKTLVWAGADINARQHSGMTPLMLAAGMGRPEMAATLLDLGANPNLKDKSDMTAFDIARKNVKFENTPVLRKLGEYQYEMVD